jgi:hypothetical protein
MINSSKILRIINVFAILFLNPANSLAADSENSYTG